MLINNIYHTVFPHEFPLSDEESTSPPSIKQLPLVAGVLRLPLRETLRREAAQTQEEGDRDRDTAKFSEATGTISPPQDPPRAASD